MKTISVAVSKVDYAVFRKAAEAEGRSIAHLIRQAMSLYRELRLPERSRLEEVPVLVGHSPLAPPPSRADLYEELFGAEQAPGR